MTSAVRALGRIGTEKTETDIQRDGETGTERQRDRKEERDREVKRQCVRETDPKMTVFLPKRVNESWSNKHNQTELAAVPSGHGIASTCGSICSNAIQLQQSGAVNA